MWTLCLYTPEFHEPFHWLQVVDRELSSRLGITAGPRWLHRLFIAASRTGEWYSGKIHLIQQSYMWSHLWDTSFFVLFLFWMADLWEYIMIFSQVCMHVYISATMHASLFCIMCHTYYGGALVCEMIYTFFYFFSVLHEYRKMGEGECLGH